MSNVRGPTSALTEFLKEKNISIRNTDRFRRRDSNQNAAQAQSGEGGASSNPAPSPPQAGPSTSSAARRAPATGRASTRGGRPSITKSASSRSSLRFEEDEDEDDSDVAAQAAPSRNGPKRAAAQRATAASKRRRMSKSSSMNFDEDEDDSAEDQSSLTEQEEDYVQPVHGKGKGARTARATRKSNNHLDGPAVGASGNWGTGEGLAPLAAGVKRCAIGSQQECPSCFDEFSVTSNTFHSVSGPLCRKCGAITRAKSTVKARRSQKETNQAKLAEDEDEAAYAQPKGRSQKAAANAARTKARATMTEYKLPTLQSLCIDIISQNIDLVEELTGVGKQNMDALSKSISRNRRLNNSTLQLFLERGATKLAFYDCSGLDSDALASIGVFAPDVEDLNLQLCGRLNNEAMSQLSIKLTKLRRLELYGPYSVYIKAWHDFFDARGADLESFKIRESPRFDLSCCQKLVALCPKLKEVGLAQVGPLNGECLGVLRALKGLTYLDVSNPGTSRPGVPPESLKDEDVVSLLQNVGSSLVTLNVGGNAGLSSRTLLEGILANCNGVSDLSLSHFENDGLSVDDWVAFFTGRAERGHAPLTHLNLERCLKINDEAFEALLEHSGTSLVELNINSCDALTSDALKLIAKHCHKLVKLDVGFVRAFDDSVIMDLCSPQEGCSSLRHISAFACNAISDWIQPKGIKLVGKQRSVRTT
ncbi:Leucine rich repeat proteins, some proteins contain F-box [Ceraceosorus bombacis]|uniref:Leucine rich repeat proteins, some proteins contain F-box n=1 Tax=Ceraceosorus bombacis TaxID=401625 RepID=A0A0P1BS63_9BASI|nr:Leucine rich repeat proteins, some proteins contain F-box [Ceraceosorus bombacis]